MNSDLRHGFYLGDLLVEPLKGEITGQIRSVHLPPKAMEVLLCLAERPGEVVTRDELIEWVWMAHQGNPDALNRAVNEIRHILDDHADTPKYIETLAKQGYRLIVSPVPLSDHAISAVSETENYSATAHIGIFANLKQRDYRSGQHDIEFIDRP